METLCIRYLLPLNTPAVSWIKLKGEEKGSNGAQVIKNKSDYVPWNKV